MIKKLLVFTDLDGTLLDHNSYRWDEALPALHRLTSLDMPLIFNTSKTIAECQPLAEAININYPMIGENGNIVSIPQHYFPQIESDTVWFGLNYDHIVTVLDQLKRQYQFQFSGFSSLGIAGVMKHTGLKREQATLACERLSSEPLLWMDSEERLEKFKALLIRHNLTLTRGGRFYHVMSPVSKGKTMAWLLKQYQALEPDTEWITVALGDGENDIEMLRAADQPVLISNPHSAMPNCSDIENLLMPAPYGPAGWNKAINQIIENTIEDINHG